MVEKVANFIGGRWETPATSRTLDVANPATGELIATVPLSRDDDVERAVRVALDAFTTWRQVPAIARARYLFRYRDLLETHAEELAGIVTAEHGKTLDESRGSIRRAIENVEYACAVPSMLMGDALEDVTAGVDCDTVRQPLGVFAMAAPFNYPAMVPLWFWPYAVAAGNTYIVKPSELVPMSQQFLFGLAEEAGFPAGVLNLLNGDKEVVDRLLEHPDVAGFSFVGTTPVARNVYRKAAEKGKRVQAFGGGRNHMVVMPDAKMDKTVATAVSSCFGCAGQRCLAGSIVVAVGDAYKRLRVQLVEAAREIVVGNGMDFAVTMGPIISARQRDRVLSVVEHGLAEGASLLLDGRELEVKGHADGNWLGPIILDDVTPDMTVAREEIFGPVMLLCRAANLDDAIAMIRASEYANTASIFTTSGRSARKFRRDVGVSMIGVNTGVAAPMAFFPLGGSKASFYGDAKAHGKDAIRFFTDERVTITRWF